MLPENEKIVGFPWYRKQNYQRLRTLFTDGDLLPATYDKWLHDAELSVKRLTDEGRTVKKVYIDPKKFFDWCLGKGLDLGQEQRALFAQEAVDQGSAGLFSGLVRNVVSSLTLL